MMMMEGLMLLLIGFWRDAYELPVLWSLLHRSCLSLLALNLAEAEGKE